MRLSPPPPLRQALFHLRRPFAPRGWPDSFSPSLRERVAREFTPILRTHPLRAEDFWKFKEGCGYAERYVSYMGPGLLNEKLLEHFVSLELLAPRKGETLIDVGAAASPFAEYCAERLGLETYALDLGYPSGVNGRKIGCSVESIPMPDASVDVMTLHCTIDHFEGACDSLFLREAARLLRPGGRLCVLPVYFAPRPANVCDPRRYSPRARFDADAEVRPVAGYNNRFGRFYSVETFRERVLGAAPSLRPELFRVEGERESIPDNYLSYALLMRAE